MVNSKKITFYGRPTHPAPESQRARLTDWPAECHREEIYEVLKKLDGVPYLSTNLFKRVYYYLTQDLKLSDNDAKLLIANKFGYGSFSGMQQGISPGLEFHKERARRPSIQAQIAGDMRSKSTLAKFEKQDDINEHRRLVKLNSGTLDRRGKESVKTFLFHEDVSYLTAIEKLLLDYTDYYLERAIEAYPVPMEFPEYYNSFGMFWNKVMSLHKRGTPDLSKPGLALIKRLCHALFSWGFRRYMAGEIIRRHAPFLPREYRKDHQACKRDACVFVTALDIDYEEMEEEEEGDNIGNR
jgi:hypothetical protein